MLLWNAWLRRGAAASCISSVVTLTYPDDADADKSILLLASS
jgi:hypothetical protein